MSALLAIYLEPRTFLGEGFLPRQEWVWLLGTLLGLPWLFPHDTPEKPLPLLRWAILAALFLPLGPTPTLGIGILFCVLAGASSWSMRPWRQRIASRYLEIAGVWLVVALTHNLYNYIAARIEGVPFVGYGLAPLLSCLGLSASVFDAQMGVQYEGLHYPVRISLDKFGGAFPWLLMGAVLFLGAIYRVPIRFIGAIAGFVFAASVAYFLWITYSWIVYDQKQAWWDEVQMAWFFAPAAMLSVFAFPRYSIPYPNRGVHRGKHAAIFSLMGAALVTWGWFWVDPGVPQEGAILIDEYYSDWEWSDVKLDTRLYGVQTVYNYYCMAEFLKHYFTRVDRNYAPLTYDTLRRYSVLVLKTPTKPYPKEVIDAIRRYIADGGGVWFIGDHTNIFGMNTYLNSILAPWHCAFRSDAAIDPDTNRQLYLPTRLAHPIVKNLPLFLFYTGCSVRAPLDALGHDVIVMPRTLRDAPDYSQNTFFGDFAPSLAETVSPTLQAYAGYVGMGRIALWADSTLFSNFAITLPGKMELAVATIDFLNRRNWLPQLRALLLGVGMLLLCSGVWLGYRRLDLLCLYTWWGALISSLWITYSYQWFYPRLQPHTPFRTIAFLEEPSSEHLPITAPVDEESSTSYLTAFVAALRVGKYAEVCMNLKQAAAHRVMVIIRGHQVSDWQVIKRYVEQGNTLILLDGGAYPQVLKQVCQLLGVGFKHDPYVAQVVADGSKLSIPVAGSFLNGDPILEDTQGQILLAETQVGKGRVYLCATENAFCDASLGKTSDIPRKEQLHLLRLLFRLYRQASEKSDL